MAALPTGVEIRGNRICIWFIHQGKRCRETLKGWQVTPANIKKAGSLRNVIMSEINLGTFSYRAHFPGSRKAPHTTTVELKTFGELTAMWIKSREAELTANTLRKTASQISTLEFIVGKDTEIAKIRHSDILSYRSALLHGETRYPEKVRGNKTGRTVRSVDNYTALLCQILRFAYRSGQITTKPFEEVKKLQKSRAKPDPLLKDEFLQLMAKCEGQSRNLWKFAVYSGLRHGELAALAWEDVDLKAGTVKVRRNLTILGHFGPPKTQAGYRTVTLLEPALEALRDQQGLTALQPKTSVTFHHREYGLTEVQELKFVFIPRMKNGQQKPHYSLSSIGASWDAAVKRAGIRRRNPYHTRHTFACWLLSAGANPAFIASQMGHENAQMVYEVYSAWMEEMNDDQVSMLNKKLNI